MDTVNYKMYHGWNNIENHLKIVVLYCAGNQSIDLVFGQLDIWNYMFLHPLFHSLFGSIGPDDIGGCQFDYTDMGLSHFGFDLEDIRA